MRFSSPVSFDFMDPLADTYHVEGADAPEEMKGRKLRRKRTKGRATVDVLANVL